MILNSKLKIVGKDVIELYKLGRNASEHRRNEVQLWWAQKKYDGFKYDLTTDEGFAAYKEVVEHMKEMYRRP